MRSLIFLSAIRYPIGSDRILCDVNHAPLLPLSLDRFPPNFPRTRIQVVARDTWFLVYPICDQPTGHGKRSATPTLFPSYSGHPIDVPYLGDFSEGCIFFQLSTSESLLISNVDTWTGKQSRHLARGGTIINRRIIFSNITPQVAPP